MTTSRRPASPPSTALATRPQPPAPLALAQQRIGAVYADLNSVLLERETHIRAALVALIARQHMVLIGAPGAAKSRLIVELTRRIEGANGQQLHLFQLLLTRFTEPAELFGPPDIPAMKQGIYRRVTSGMLPEADVCFADEPFKASSAVLNTLLTIMNERQFDNGGQRIGVPLISLFGASNELPQGDDLGALWDRFALRLTVEYLSESGFAQLLAAPPTTTAAPQTISLDDLQLLQDAAASMPLSASLCDVIAKLRLELGQKGIVVSDRRWLWICDLIRAHAVLDGKTAPDEDDLAIVPYALWNTPDQQKDIRQIVGRMANPINARALELSDQAESIYAAAIAAQNGSATDETKSQALIDAIKKFKSIGNSLKVLVEQAQSEGRSTQRIERVRDAVRTQHRDLNTRAVGDIA